MPRNFGLDNKSHTYLTLEDIAMEKKIEFWIGFFIGGVSASVTLLVLVALLALNMPA